ncbi:MAG: hypothetical protein MUC32_02940 [Burkholderiaceae bacterium]|jgi:hypothetical protein|nr:hypothetical protein [Burkholderiaceae bacterium]
MTHAEATREGGFFVVLGGERVALHLVDSITEAIGRAAGAAAVSGSHGGTSAARFALEAGVVLAVFNDAGVGRDGAGIAALWLLQARGVAACAVAHTSARIGAAQSTWNDGVISHVNDAARALGARPGVALRAWLAPA